MEISWKFPEYPKIVDKNFRERKIERKLWEENQTERKCLVQKSENLSIPRELCRLFPKSRKMFLIQFSIFL